MIVPKVSTIGKRSPSHTTIHKKPLPPKQTYTMIITLLITLTYAHTYHLSPHITTHTTTPTPNIEHTIHKSTTTSPYHKYTPPSNTKNTSQHTTPQKPPPTHTPINNINNIGTICHTTHSHHKTPKTKIIQYYTWNNSILILICGDIQLNPGPLSYIIKNLTTNTTPLKTYLERPPPT